MITRSPLMVIVGSFALLFGAILIAVIAWVGADTNRVGPFDTAFSLVDDRGNPVDKSLFRGSPSLVYFGYTNCPEVCPTTLFEVSGYLDALGEEGAPLKAYFFSVDPERDTPAIMHGYVTAFTDRITGVTGRAEEMQKVIDGWMIHAAKQPSEDGNYHMSHTMSLLLIGADGRLKGLLPYGSDQQEALDKIRRALL